jgi:hypothetical protein
VNGGLTAIDRIKTDEWVDFEIGKVEVCVDRIETNKEVNQSLLLFRWNVLKESGCNFASRREGLANRDRKTKSFCIDVSNIDTTFMGKKNFVTFTVRVDTNVVFSVGRMREERFYNKVG